MNPKSILESKMTWLGIATSVLGFAQYATTDPVLAQYPSLLWGLGLAIVALRYFTETPLQLTKPTDPLRNLLR